MNHFRINVYSKTITFNSDSSMLRSVLRIVSFMWVSDVEYIRQMKKNGISVKGEYVKNHLDIYIGMRCIFLTVG